MVRLTFLWQGRAHEEEFVSILTMGQVLGRLHRFLNITTKNVQLIYEGKLISSGGQLAALRVAQLTSHTFTVVGMPQIEFLNALGPTMSTLLSDDAWSLRMDPLGVEGRRYIEAKLRAQWSRAKNREVPSIPPATMDNPQRRQPRHQWQRRGFGHLAGTALCRTVRGPLLLNRLIGIGFLPRYVDVGPDEEARKKFHFCNEFRYIAILILEDMLKIAEEEYERVAGRRVGWSDMNPISQLRYGMSAPEYQAARAMSVINSIPHLDLGLRHDRLDLGTARYIVAFWTYLKGSLELDNIVIENSRSDGVVEDIDSIRMLIDMLLAKPFLDPDRKYKPTVAEEMLK